MEKLYLPVHFECAVKDGGYQLTKDEGLNGKRKIVPIHPNKCSKQVPYKFVCLHEFMGIYKEDDSQQIPSLDYEKALRFINRWGPLQSENTDEITFVNFEMVRLHLKAALSWRDKQLKKVNGRKLPKLMPEQPFRLESLGFFKGNIDLIVAEDKGNMKPQVSVNNLELAIVLTALTNGLDGFATCEAHKLIQENELGQRQSTCNVDGLISQFGKRGRKTRQYCNNACKQAVKNYEKERERS
tara:strand:- start:3026 stop:3748 length:723 start_codon:yes stop_codon:yes gene_type:complete